MKNSQAFSHVDSIKKMMKEIANNKLVIQNNLEVVYKLAIFQDILGDSIQRFLSQSDENTKNQFLSIVTELFDEKYNNVTYKDLWWRAVNNDEFAPTLLEAIQEKDDNELHLIFNNFMERLHLREQEKLAQQEDE